MCKSYCELMLGIAVIVFALLASLGGYMWALWVVVIAGVVLVVHSFTCKQCFVDSGSTASGAMKATKRK